MIAALRGLCLQILEGKEARCILKRAFVRQLEESATASSQLQQAYLSLAAHLLQLEPLPLFPEQLPNGAALLHTSGASLPEPRELAELGTIWMVLGACLKNELLVRAGLKVATWHVHLLDREGRPHLSLWSPAETFSLAALQEWSYALFQAAYLLTGHAGFHTLATLFQEGATPTTAALLTQMQGVAQLTPPRSLAEEVSVGILKFATSDMSLMAHVSGWNSGFLSVHKKELALLNCGPHVGPYDVARQFGIARTLRKSGRTFQDVHWEKSAYHCHLRGWTQVLATPLWVHLDIKAQSAQVTCEIAFQEGDLREASLLFFLKGARLTVGGKQLLEPGALTQYEGEAKALELSGREEIMTFAPETVGSMRIIPLAGGPHFWGADFLVGFSGSNNLSIIIK